MAKKKVNRFDEIQPNSSTREELLVIMYYLQNYAYDYSHATTQKEIIDFAKENFGIEIRRDRIGSILIHLEQISTQKPDLLPFILCSKQLSKIRKYYVPRKQMSDNDVAKICSIIIGDKKLSAAETKRLMDAFVSVNATKGQKKTILDKINVRAGKRRKASDESYDTYELFNRLCEYKEKMLFRLRDPYVAEYSKRLEPKIRESFTSFTEGYPAFTYEIKDYTKYVIYVKKYKLGIITSIENLDIIEDMSLNSIFDSNYDMEYELDINTEDKSLKSWVDAHYKGIDGILYHFKLKVVKNRKGKEDEKSFIEFEEKFKEYWSKPLEYTLSERVIESEIYPKGAEETVVYDAVFELDANRSSFDHWYLDLGNYDKVVILEPAMLNDIYLSEKVDRYAKRINKYGSRYQYTITKDYKPEYLEKRNEIKKRILEKRKQRLESLEEGKPVDKKPKKD